MRKHQITLAALFVALAPLTATAQVVVQASASDVVAEEGLPSVVDEQGMEPVYAPGNHFGGQYYPGQAPGPSCGCGSCGCQECEPEPCGQSCCECCPCCCGPRFEFHAAGVVLRRSNPGDVPFISNSATGVPYFTMSQFNFDFEPGVDGSVIAYINPCVSVEARYLALFNVSDEVVAGPFAPTAAGGVFYNTTPPTTAFFPGTTVITADYDSKLQSGEINLRGRAAPWLTVLGGFRYINLRERFHAHFDFTSLPPAPAPLGTADYNDRVESNLYGIQLGAEVDFFQAQRRRLNFNGFAKAGMYAVQADRDVSVVATPIGGAFGPANTAGSASDTQAAFVGEAGLSASFQVTRYMSVSAGYQVLYLDGVAVASDQIASTGNLFANPIPTRVDVDGHVFYHGANAGVDFRY